MSPSTREARARPVTGAGRWLGERVRAAAFWTAVALPAAYLPLLVAADGARWRTAALALLAVHAVALVLGHGHAD